MYILVAFMIKEGRNYILFPDNSKKCAKSIKNVPFYQLTDVLNQARKERLIEMDGGQTYLKVCSLFSLYVWWEIFYF